jgi:hypothetical protein
MHANARTYKHTHAQMAGEERFEEKVSCRKPSNWLCSSCLIPTTRALAGTHSVPFSMCHLICTVDVYHMNIVAILVRNPVHVKLCTHLYTQTYFFQYIWLRNLMFIDLV